MKILLIAGHGAGDPGASGIVGGKRYREADEARTIVAMLAADLQNRYKVDVGVYNPERDPYKDAKAGRYTAAIAGYGYVLEIHFNAVAELPEDGKTKGTEIYITYAEKADAVEQKIVRNIAALGLANRGVKRKNWAAIDQARAKGISAALLEICFIDDPDDMQIYLRDRGAVVHAIAEGIAEGFGLAKRPRTSREIVQQAAGLSDATMTYLEGYKYGSDLLRKLADAIGR